MIASPSTVRPWFPQQALPPQGWLDLAKPEAGGTSVPALASASALALPTVWLARLADAEPFMPELAAELSPAERARAEGYHRKEDRARSILGRALVRRLLGAHLGQAPKTLEILLGQSGKPRLSNAVGDRPQPCFNLSHSGNLVLAAFHPTQAVGVDVEAICDDFECAEVSAHTFPPRVHADWLRLPAVKRPRAFYQAWTRHEAGLKASGHGLSGRVEVSAPGDWENIDYHALEVPDGYAAHLAVVRIP